MEKAFDGDLIQEHVHLDEVDSTNRYALDAGRVGLLVSAKTQTGGKGTKGRTWFSPAGSNLYMTITVGRPDGRFPLVAGVAVHQALSSILPETRINIKWPNDIIISGSKVCGILCETKGALTAVGIGINVNQTSWPDELWDTAVSLAQISSRQYDLDQVMNQIIIDLKKWLVLFYREGFFPVRQRFLEYGLLHDYKLLTEEGLSCTIVGLDMEGHLLVNVSGKLKTLVSGSLTLAR
jgi:BirA family biotin operon repressor/biotin-[acetyl-CoA-carboxylase] ligase